MAITLVELFNIVANFSFWAILIFYASRHVSLPPVLFHRLLLGAYALQCLGFVVFVHFMGNSLAAVHLYHFLMFTFRVVFAFLLYRNQLFQNLFYLAFALLCLTVAHACGIIVEDGLAGQPLLFARLMNRLTVFVACCIMLPPMVFVLRRLQRQMRQDHIYIYPLWRLLWVIPCCMQVLLLITSPRQVGWIHLPGTLKGGVLIISRALILVCLFVTCFIASEVMRYSRHAELARMRWELLKGDVERQKKVIAEIPENSLVTCGPLALNLAAGQAYLHGRELPLPPKEFGLLHHFIRNEGEVISREALYSQIWQQPFSPKDRALESSVYRLRKKLEESGYTIATVRGQGYRLERTDF